MSSLDRKPVQARQETAPSNAPFYVVLFYLLLEFGRPQDVVPGLSMLSLPMLTIGVIGILLFTTGKVIFRDKQTIFYLAILSLMVLHGPIAVNNFHALMTFKDMVLYFVAFLGIIAFVDSIAKFKTLTAVWVGIHGYLAIMGIVLHGRGVGGWMGDENDFCMQLNMVVGFAYFGCISAHGKFKQGLSLGLLCTCITATPLSSILCSAYP